MKTIGLVLTGFLVATAMSVGYGQEICNNGKDDDGDGFIDCFDSNCAGNAACANFYIGNDVVCQAKPSAFPQFSMKLKWGSDNQTTNHLNRTSIGDLNRDGIPEVYATEIQGNYIYKLDGKTGKTLKSLNLTNIDREIVIGNINNDNCGQVFVSTSDNSNGIYRIYAYDCNLNFLWKSPRLNATAAQFGLADFDNDGKVEIYTRDEILDAHTGVRIVAGTNSDHVVGQGIAVDILNNDNKLELVLGCQIFSVSLGNRSSGVGSLSLQKSVSSFNIRQVQSSTSVADYNQDGNLDIIASGSDGAEDDNTTLYFWDVTNNVVKKYIDKISTKVFIAGCTNASGYYYSNGWQNGTGRVNIADIDGDGKMNAAYVSGKYLYALDENWNLKWRVTVNEETSGYTGCTVYDFNGDGAAEVVYRDEQYLYIINGKDGSVNTSQQCIARTNVEYPVVADVDGDGATDLCVTCGFDDKLAWSNFCDLNYSINSHVRVFQSAGVPWVPSRKVWNQHGYFNVNINDDLSIPKIMQKSWLVWSTGTCTQGPNRPLNTFLNQTPYLDSKGCPTYASPDLVNVKSLLSVQAPTCPDTDFTITMGVQNVGDVTINGNVPITFYSGDPTKAGAVKLNTITIPVVLKKNESATFPALKVTGTGGAFTLYIALNDAGTTVPTPIKLPNSSFIECDYDNVLSASVIPKPGTVTAVKVSDNVKCLGATVPDNGAAKAYVLVNGVQNTTDYNFSWYNGPVAGAPVYTGSSYSGLAAGTYSVVATHKTAGCSTDVGTVTINRVNKTMTASIVVDKPNTSCSAPNGQLHAVVNGGDPVTNYTFKWYEGNDIFTSPEVGVGYIATNLKGGKTYTVLVTDISSGCQAVVSLAEPDNSVNPTVTATPTDAICVPANSGSATANVGGITTGYTFNWYNGVAVKPAADFTGATYNSIAAGSYTVVATDNTSGCNSASKTVTVGLPPAFTVSPSQTAQQTSCNAAAPNGTATANVGGVTAGFTFAWFTGMSTAPANAIAGPTGLAAGTYTVQATKTATGCTATNTVTITQQLTYPVVSLTPAANTTCDPTKGSAAYNGSVAATVTFSGGPVGTPAPNYTFAWHNGPLSTDPAIGGNTTSITGLNGGSYTLVVTRLDVACSAAPVTAVVLNTPATMTIVTSATGSTNCLIAKANGQIMVTQVDATTPAPTVGVTYAWTGPGAPSFAVNNGTNNANTKNLIKVQGGAGYDYTVVVTRQSDGCQVTKAVNVPDARVNPQLSMAVATNSICNSALTSPAVNYNGSGTINVTNMPAGGVSTDYTYAFLPAGGNQAGGSTGNKYDQLNTAKYTVTVTQTATGCFTKSGFEVFAAPAAMTIATSSTGSTNCVATKEDGTASVTQVDGGTPSSGVTYAWTGPGAPAFAVNNGTNKANTKDLIKVQGGTGYDYTVVVTRQSDGCQVTQAVNVQDSKALPAITLTKADNTICDASLTSPSVPFNGKVTAAITNQVGALSNYTFAYGGGGAQTPGGGSKGSPTANVWSNLNGGATSYTVQVTQTPTGCVSSVASIALSNTPNPMSILTNTIGSTNCVATKEDGQAIVTQVDATTPAPTVGVTYAWTGPGGAPAFPVSTGTNNSNTKTLIKVQGGTGYDYTVVVTRQSDGCQVTKAVNVPDAKALPAVTLAKTDNTICNAALTSPLIPFNGRVTATITNQVGALTNYTFAYGGGGAQTPGGGVQGSPTANVWSNLNGGATSYTVQVTQTPTGCVSSVASIALSNTPNPMSILTNTIGSTNCVATKEDGQAIVTQVDATTPAPTVGVTYAWTGPGGAPAFPVSTGTNNSDTKTLIKVQGGTGYDYTVVVTRQSDGCQVTKAVNVPDAKALPAVTLAKTDNTICNAALTSPLIPFNGRVTATITNQVGALTNYTFAYGGGGAQTPGGGVQGSPTANVWSNLNGGATSYTVQVTQTPTGCVSSVASIALSNTPNPMSILTNTIGSTNCVVTKEDGQAIVTQVDATTPAPTVGVTYAWTGPGGAPAFPVSTGTNNSDTKTLIKVQGGTGYDYTVVVTRQSDGCQVTKAVNVPDAKALPAVTLAKTDNTICNVALTSPLIPFNGRVTATITNQVGALTNYTFAYGGGGAQTPGGGVQGSPTANAWDQLNGGATSYTVQVTQTPTGCVSSVASIALSNTPNPMSILTNTIGSTNCVATKEDGQAIVTQVDATTPAPTVGVTYAWTGPGGAPAFPVSTGTNNSDTKTLIKVQGGTGYDYTVVVTRQSDGCQVTKAVNVPDAKALPAVTLAKTDNTICNAALTSPLIPFNGRVTATITNQVGALTNYTFAYGGGGAQTPGGGVQGSPTANAWDQLNGGATSYTVQVTQTPTGCVSSVASIALSNTPNPMSILTNTIGSTNCVATKEDGQAIVTQVDATTPAPTVGVTYAWTGPGGAPAFPVSTGTNNSDTKTLIKVQGGTGYDYTVVVTRQSDGCQVTKAVNVPDAKALPAVTLAKVDNKVCDPALTSPHADYNGSITATITNQVGALTNYTFAFTDAGGQTPGGGSPGSPTADVWSNLNGGPSSYSVQVTQVATGCVSAIVSTTLLSNAPLPMSIATAATDSKNCVIGKEDGTASVITVDGNPAATATGYSYAWTGPSGSPVFAVTPVPNNSNTRDLIKVQGGTGYNYTVVVTRSNDGCQVTQAVGVGDSKQLPVLTLTPQPNTICDPSKTNPPVPFDGQVTALVNSAGNYTGNVPGDFTFTWSTSLTGVGQNQLLNQDVGNYSVTAVHTNSGCTSALASANVTSGKKLPTITMDQTPSTNCTGGTADGIAKVIDVTPHGKNYDYKWFDGNSTAGTAGPTTLNTTVITNNYSGVQGGNSGASLLQYTVEVTILQTGCQNTESVGVADNKKLPKLKPLISTDNTICVGTPDGTASVNTALANALTYRGSNIASPYTASAFGGFTFAWTGPSGYTAAGFSVASIGAGVYSLTATNTASNCTSNPVSVTIKDNLFTPKIDVVEVDQTSCVVASPNGKLTATIDEAAIGGPAGVTAGYSFTWVNDVTSASTVSNQITGQKGNQTYTLTVKRTSTGCTNSETDFIKETLTTPTIFVAVTDMTTCSPYNGKLVATPSPGLPAAYDYFWFDGSNAASANAVVTANNGGLLPGSLLTTTIAANDTYSQLYPSDYTVVVQDKATKCVSAQVIKTIANNAPAINPLAENTTLPGDCSLNTGVLTGAVRTLPLTNFHALAATDELTLAAPLALIVGQQVLIGKQGTLALPGNVLVREDVTFFVESVAGAVITLKDATNTHVDLISDGDGTISDFVTAGYTYNWYPGVPSGVVSTNPINYYSLPANPPDFGPLGAPSAGSVYNGLKTGLYTVEITDVATGCKNFVSHTLPFVGSQAVIKIFKTNSKFCSPSPQNGTIKVEIQDPVGAPGGADYTVKLGAATLFTNALQNVTLTLSTTLAPGSYVVTAIQNYLPNCPVSQDVVIGRDAMPPVVDLASAIIPNDACLAASHNGKIPIKISADPTDPVVATYDLTLAPDPHTFSATGLAAGTYTAVGLDPNTYSATVTASTGCVTNKSFIVSDAPVKAQLTAADLTVKDAEFCTPALETLAKIFINQLNVIGGAVPENMADYQFKWTNVTTSTVIVNNVAGDASNNGTGGDELVNGATVGAGVVTVGSYSVVATKVADASGTGGIGCASAPFTVKVNDKSVNPVITLTPTGDTSCDPAVFEGSIQVDVTTASGPGMAATYGYTWTPNGGAGQPANSASGNSGAGNMFNNINDGSYSLVAKNDLTGCTSTLATVVAHDTPPVFTLSATAVNETNCGPFDGSIGTLQVSIDGIAYGGASTDFDYVWFRSNLATKVLDGQNGGVPVDNQLTLATYAGIGLDKYFVKAINKTAGPGAGCESAAIRKDILDDRVFPQLSFATAGSSSCDNNFDGSITVTASTTGFAAATTNYIFDWTSNPLGTTITDITTLSNPSQAFKSEAIGGGAGERVGPGTYLITVTNTLNNCSTNGSVNVQQITVPFVVSGTTTTDRTNCTLFNGSATLTQLTLNGGIVGAGIMGTDFGYVWKDSGGGTVSTAILTGTILDFGNYTVVATKNPGNTLTQAASTPASGCSTAPLQVTVKDARAFPTVSFATTPSTSCDNNFDGSITVTAATTGFAAATTNYNFDWTSKPALSVITDKMGVLSNPSQDFQSEAIGGATFAGERVGQGTYVITVTNLSNNCAVVGASVDVQQNTVPFVVSGTTTTDRTNCTLFNGSATLTQLTLNGGIVGAGIMGTDFGYVWKDSGGGTVSTAILTGTILDFGNYTVVATKNPGNTLTQAASTPASGCSTAPLQVTVKDARAFPVVSFATTPSTSCDNNFDGSITVTAATTGFAAATTNYNFDWTSKPALSVITDKMGVLSNPSQDFQSEAIGGATFAGERVGQGTYVITVTNLSNNCAVVGASVDVQQNTVPFVVSGTTTTDRTNCTLFNGSATLTQLTLNGGIVGAGIMGTDFGYVWKDSGGGTVSTAILTGTILDFGNYTVVATKNPGNTLTQAASTPASGCSTAPLQVTVNDKRAFPVVSFATTPSTSCDNNFDGSITVTAATTGFAAATTNYNFDWTSKPALSVITDKMGVLSNPSQDFQSEAIGGATFAGERVGQGTYVITVTNLSNNCAVVGASVDVQQNTVPFVVSGTTTTDRTNCTLFNGSATLTQLTLNGGIVGAGIMGTDFGYVWKDSGGGTVSTAILTGTILDFGNYTVVATKNPGNTLTQAASTPASGCSTAPLQVTVNDKRAFPVVSFATTPSTSCDNNFDGSITVTAATTGFAAATTNYNFDWTSKPALSVITDKMGVLSNPSQDFQSEAIGGATFAGERVGQGTYVITVTNLSNNCAVVGASVDVQQNTVPFVVSGTTTTDRTNCTLFNGSATLTQLTLNGGIVGAGIMGTDFGYVWKDSGGGTVSTAILTGTILDFGNYTVVATKNPGNTLTQAASTPASGCSTAPLQVTVNDKRAFPVVSFATTPSTSCDNNFDGSITVTAATTGFAAATTNYNFDWTSKPALSVITDKMGVLSNPSQDFQSEAIGGATFAGERVGQGTYVITVTNLSNNCAVVGASVDVQQNTVPFVVSGTTTTDRTNCTLFNGSATLTQLTLNGGIVGAGIMGTDFGYVWKDSGGGTVSTAILTGTILDFGNYTVVATKNPGNTLTQAASTPASGCSTAPLQVTVNDKRAFPVVSFATTPSTSCDNNFDGSITVTAATTGFAAATTNYNFDWTSKPALSVITDKMGVLSNPSQDFQSEAIGGATFAGERVGQGTYVITVTNLSNNCAVVGASVDVQQNTVPFDVTNIVTADRDNCVLLNGSAGLTQLTLNGTPLNGGILGTDFSYVWKNSVGGTVSIAQATGTILDIGDYTVVATKKSTLAPAASTPASGCSTAPFQITINDKRIDPLVSITTIGSSSCDLNYDGQIKVTATTASGPGAAGGVGYNFVWTSDPDLGGGQYTVSNSATNNTASPFVTPSTDKIGPQAGAFTNPYTVRVTNFATGCFTDESTQVNQVTIPMTITNVTSTDVTLCTPATPDGSATIATITETPGPGNVANYTYTWSSSATMSPTLGVVNDPLLTRNNLAAGTYFVIGTHKAVASPGTPGITGSGCVTAPASVEIKDIHVNPTIAAATINPDVNCAGGPGAGSIKINEATPLNFTYAWFTGDNTSGAPVATLAGVNGEVAQSLQEGDYTVRVTSNATQCISTQSYVIANNPTTVAFDPAAFTAPAITTCNLATGIPSNGSATVVSILENNVSKPVTNYTFTWTDAASTVLQSGASNVLNNIVAGKYFVTALNTVSNCSVNFEFKVDDQTIGSTTVALIDFNQPERCVNPKTGYLTVQGGGNGTSYSYEWFAGDQRPSPAGATVATGATISNIPNTSTFTVKAINGSNNCWAVDAYNVPLITNPVIITASATPLTFCSSNNGEVFSTIVNDNRFEYNFYWTNGAAPKIPPASDFTGNEVFNLPVGTYTVVAVDKADAGCMTPSATVTIVNQQVIPVVSARVLKDLTICDPTRPDGDASADVAGDFVHYTFDWYAGGTATGTSFYTGAEVSGLAATTYTVQGTDKATGCAATASVVVKQNFAKVPDPTIELISNVTSCVVNNGELSATVGGITKDYIFDWANGTTAPPPIAFTGEFYKDLAEGNYTVVATSRATGCASGPATAPIVKKQQYPEVSFLLQEATCPLALDPPANLGTVPAPAVGDGFITLLVNNNLPIETITWYKQNTVVEVGEGPNLEKALPGDYSVTVRTTFGCEKSFDVNLPMEINVFNGVSMNGDDKNSYFHIGCISSFERNHVEIFNRAGTKVYEADGYNNKEIRFDGKSNQGISIMGTNLPPGTYFYVISKGNGAKRIAGYMELVE